MRPAKDVDEYIANAPEGTRPILEKLRQIFRKASPKLEEAIKWGVPCFEYKGMVGGFAAYKKHVSWALWQAELLDDADGLLGLGIKKGGKIASMSEIPPTSKLLSLIKQAVALNEAGIKPAQSAREPKPRAEKAAKPSAAKSKPKTSRRPARTR
jgi:hypothetical protein